MNNSNYLPWGDRRVNESERGNVFKNNKLFYFSLQICNSNFAFSRRVDINKQMTKIN